MTNEEALSILHCPDAYGGIYGEKYGEALSMAMEALKREPCDDCVSRQAVLSDIQSNWDWETVDGITATTVLKQVMTDITNMLSVTPARPKGKWIYLNDEIEIYDHWYQCSVCHKESFEHRFCPYCGAEMVGTTRRD